MTFACNQFAIEQPVCQWILTAAERWYLLCCNIILVTKKMLTTFH